MARAIFPGVHPSTSRGGTHARELRLQHWKWSWVSLYKAGRPHPYRGDSRRSVRQRTEQEMNSERLCSETSNARYEETGSVKAGNRAADPTDYQQTKKAAEQAR